MAHHTIICAVLQDKFGLNPCNSTIHRFEQAYNNYVYYIELANPTSEPLVMLDAVAQHFTTPIPANTSRLVFRIPKENVNLEDSVRVRNEVAFLALARDAVASIGTSLIPQVFAWDDGMTSPGSRFGWILEEWKAGERLSGDQLEQLDEDTCRLVLGQIAAVVKAFQDYCLPDSIKGFGGLTFDHKGTMSTTASTIPCGGPFTTYANSLKGMCEWQLEASGRSALLNSWRDVPKLRQRLDALFTNGLDNLLAEVPEQKQTLVHADLCKYKLFNSQYA